MYNRYIPNGTAYTRVREEDAPPFRHHNSGNPPSPEQGPPHPPGRGQTHESSRQKQQSPPTQGAATETTKPSWLSGLLKNFKLDDLDTGDILLLLILLFLFIDGDDMEMVITLGLLLLFGLGGKDKNEDSP